MDRWVGETLYEWTRDHPLVADGLRAVTALGRPQTLLVLAVLSAIGLAARGRARLGVYLVVATLGAWLLDNGLKELVDRTRPAFGDPLVRSSGASFPSGHAMTAAGAYGAVAIVAKRGAVTVGAALLVALIALSRVALGVHWLTDVVVGVVLGGAWAWATARVLLRGEEDLRPRDRAAPEDLPRVPGRNGEAEPR